MVDIIERSFRLNLRILSLSGSYPEGNSLSTHIRVYVSYIFFMAVVVLDVLKIVAADDADLVHMNFNMIFIIENVAFCFKYLSFFTNRDRIRRCVNYFRDSKFSARDHEEEKIIEECVRVCRRNSSGYFTAVVITATFWVISSFFERKMPVEVWLPYDPNDSLLAFYATFCCLAANFMMVCLCNQMDPLISGLSYHATSQLKILKYNLRTLDKHFDLSHDEAPVIKLEDLDVFLRKCVDHHEDILNFVAEYESCFSFSMFCQIASSMFTMCFCCIGIILTTGFDLFRSAASFFLAAFQIVFYCHYGTLLFEENEKFIEAVFMGPWYKYDSHIKKILIIMTERSKKPLLISAGFVVKVTLQTFASVLKTSYSLIAVFRN